jgi:large subunit ribosomal protein L25
MTEKITAEARTEFGKGAARRTRREGKIPAVVYAAGGDATHINLPSHVTTMALRNHGVHAVLELEIDGKAQFVKTQQVQVDPLKRVIEHIDFLAIDAKDVKAVEAEVEAEEAAEEAAHVAAAEAASHETHENDAALDAPSAEATEGE